MDKLPSKKILEETSYQIMQINKTMTASELNDAVANHLEIPEDLLAIEDANCTGTEFSYRMRWVRTTMKKKGVLENPERGVWIFIE